MCLILFDWQPGKLILGGNREESRKKPHAYPTVLGKEGVRVVVAGADYGRLETSQARLGSWLGVNNYGLVVAVTNRDDGHAHNTLHSRGWPLIEMLCYPSAFSAVEVASIRLREGGYGGANYIIMDREEAWWVRAPGCKDVNLQEIKPGKHVITNLDLDDPEDVRIKFAHEYLKEKSLSLRHAEDLCLHNNILVPDKDWGTLSSTIVLQHGDEFRFRHTVAEHEPTPYGNSLKLQFKDYQHLMREEHE